MSRELNSTDLRFSFIEFSSLKISFVFPSRLIFFKKFVLALDDVHCKQTCLEISYFKTVLFMWFYKKSAWIRKERKKKKNAR